MSRHPLRAHPPNRGSSSLVQCSLVHLFIVFLQHCFSVTNKQLFEPFPCTRMVALQLICCYNPPASLTGFMISQISLDSKLRNLYKLRVLSFVFSVLSEPYIKLMFYKLLCLQLLGKWFCQGTVKQSRSEPFKQNRKFCIIFTLQVTATGVGGEHLFKIFFTEKDTK